MPSGPVRRTAEPPAERACTSAWTSGPPSGSSAVTTMPELPAPSGRSPAPPGLPSVSVAPGAAPPVPAGERGPRAGPGPPPAPVLERSPPGPDASGIAPGPGSRPRAPAAGPADRGAPPAPSPAIPGEPGPPVGPAPGGPPGPRASRKARAPAPRRRTSAATAAIGTRGLMEAAILLREALPRPAGASRSRGPLPGPGAGVRGLRGVQIAFAGRPVARPAEKLARSRSRFSRAMNSRLISLGQTASHSPGLVQLPKPSPSMGQDHVQHPPLRAPAAPAAGGPGG